MASSSSSSDLSFDCWLQSSLDLDMETQKQNVESMDIDQVIDVPDTPDRMMAAQKSNGVVCVNVDSNAQLPRRIGNSYCPGEGNRDGTNREHNRKILFRPPRKVVRSSIIEHNSNNIVDLSEELSPSRNAQSLRRSLTSKHDSTHSLRPHLMDKGKDICAPSPVRINLGKRDGGQDIREQRGHVQLLENSSPHGTLRDPLARDRRKVANMTNQYAFKGKGKLDDDSSSPLAHHGKGIDITPDSQALIEKPNFASHNSIALSRAAGRKRLVRNGCISPNNIAKANLLAERNSTHEDPVQIHGGVGKMTAESPLLINVSDSSAERKNFHRNKGKGVISHPGTSDEIDARTQEFSSWSLNVHNERDNGRRNFVRKEAGLSEGLGGWRSTHNHSKEISLPTSNESKFSAWISDSVGRSDASEDKIGRTLVQSNRAESDYPEIVDIVSSRPASSSVIPQNTAAESIATRRRTSNTLSKRQRKQGSTSAVDLNGSDVMLLGSSRQPSTSTVIINQSSDDPSAVHPMTGVHGSSSDSRETEFLDLLGNSDLDARARQLEADEILARELQEQLYQEMPIAGSSEMDANLAWMVQHDPNALTASSSRNQLPMNSRSSMVPPLSRQPRSRLLHPPSVRRGTRSRAQATSRVAQLRSRIHSTAPSSLPRERSVFPLNMALDTRIDVLEALEAAFGDISDMGAASHILHFQRDFNENDYEMLLSLDDSNQQNGASAHMINSLPESTVESENFEETCAICLETPALGDVIRHLPCFHKFHKDCIDPWLSRKTSCPVCKSSTDSLTSFVLDTSSSPT